MDVKPEFAEIFRTLARHEVRFVVVGGVASNLQGAGFFTEDVDVLAEIDPENVARLAAALHEMDARYKDFAGRLFLPDARRLLENRLNLLETRFGRLDVLKAMGKGVEYSSVGARADRMEVAGIPLLVATLEDLIEAKEAANREKDRNHLLILRAVQAARRSAQGGKDPGVK